MFNILLTTMRSMNIYVDNKFLQIVSLVISKYISNTYPYLKYVWIQESDHWVFAFRGKINLCLSQVYPIKSCLPLLLFA